MSATDSEGDELSYGIASNTAGSASFRMNATTGVLTVGTVIDREVRTGMMAVHVQ